MENTSRAGISWIQATSLLLVASIFGGCASLQRVGIALFYKEAKLPKRQVINDVFYAADGASEPKHRLDLFLPQGTNWPVLIFVHGGNWNAGDKSLRVGGADVYGNIGRFFASRGIGVAVVNYRLQPQVVWQEQVKDVAAATSWVHSHIGRFGGDPQQIFLSGHSAGAQLATHVALKPDLFTDVGSAANSIRGVIAVSGAGLDLRDAKTYELGADPDFYEQRFGNENPNWQREASPIASVTSSSPPFLILYGGKESASLKRQSWLLHGGLHANGVQSWIIEVPHQSHARMVLTLSRPDKIAAPAMIDFIKRTAELH